MSPGGVALEIFSVRLTPTEVEQYQQLWEEVDEQSLPVEVRRRLARNGFRVGVLAGQIPTKLAHLLELRDKPVGDITQSLTPKELADPPRTTLRHLQTRAGELNEITTSGVYDQMPVLLTDSGELGGHTYNQAQGVFGLKVNPQPDGRVQLDLTPEVQHDQVRQRLVGDQAMFRYVNVRPKRSFDDLRITPVLSAGAILILGCQIDRVGSLGHYFFHELAGGEEKLQTKLVLIRVGQTQNDDLVSPPPLPLSQ
jgi:hypothetical protein